jgi:hypothetical protein
MTEQECKRPDRSLTQFGRFDRTKGVVDGRNAMTALFPINKNETLKLNFPIPTLLAESLPRFRTLPM